MWNVDKIPSFSDVAQINSRLWENIKRITRPSINAVLKVNVLNIDVNKRDVCET